MNWQPLHRPHRRRPLVCHARPCTASVSIPMKKLCEPAHDEGCDVIFMASHGRRGIQALIMGGETHKVLTHTKIPVLVFR